VELCTFTISFPTHLEIRQPAAPPAGCPRHTTGKLSQRCGCSAPQPRMRRRPVVSSGPGRRVVPRWPGARAQEPAVWRRFHEACHDMRQPVAVIRSLATATLAEPGLPSATRLWLEQILNEAESLAELIEHSLTRTDPAGEHGQTNLGQLAHEVVAGEQLTYQGQLQVMAPADTIAISVSRVDARRIIANLLSNATRAAGPGGQVLVHVASNHDCATLVVEDSGPGFARIQPGTGLGSGVIAGCLIRCGGLLQYGRSKTGGVKATVSLPLAGS
jgi:K+-sensing histidine kinase KdpD